MSRCVSQIEVGQGGGSEGTVCRADWSLQRGWCGHHGAGRRPGPHPSEIPIGIVVQALDWVGIGCACAEWTPIEVGNKSLTGRPFQISFCAPLCSAKLPRSTFCWLLLLLLLLLISRDFTNFNFISRPSLRPHRAFCGLGDRHPITAGRLLGLDSAAKIRQRPAAGLLTAQQ